MPNLAGEELRDAIQAKYKAEERAESARLGLETSSSWILIPHLIREDWNQLRRGSIPTHVEVILRISVSSLLGYILAVGDFPNVIPQSQRVLIAVLASTLGMLFPTLLFTVGFVMFPQMMFVLLLGLALATMLLACAAGVGVGFYTFMFGLTAFVISGMRFDKATGAMTCFLVIEMALNSQGLAAVAEESGIEFVRSLWSERGVTNPKALYTNTLVGMMWIIFCMVVGRILPPFRTARSGIAKGLLPSSLKAVAASIDLNAEDLQLLLKLQGNKTDGKDDDGSSKKEGVSEEGSDDEASPCDLEKRRANSDAMLIHDKTLLNDGKIAAMTVFEPRMLRFGPPECSWVVLKALCEAVDRTILASLVLGDAWKNHQELSLHLEQHLLPSHLKAAAALRKCADAIMNTSKVETDAGKGSTIEVAQASPEEDAQEVVDSLAHDPIFFESVSREVVAATNDWAKVAGPPDRSKPCFDKEARKSIKLNIVPWFKGSVFYLIALIRNWQSTLNPESWDRVFRPPRYEADKLAWRIDFTIGFTALVAMGIYWEAYAQLENESWFLISYAFSTTQTAEGTVKKGILRLMGTAAGGFSGWLALSIFDTNVYGLVAWLTIFTAIAAYIGLPRGFKARMGLKPDFGYGPAYFVMTQALVVTQVLIGEGDKKTVTTNRIATNAIGISVAIVLALLPPALYGGNPKFARQILDEEKSFIVKCIQLLLELPQSAESQSKSANSTIQDKIQKIRTIDKTKIAKLLEQANDFYSDSAKLRSFRCLTVDPKLKEILDRLEVNASSIFVAFGFALQTLKNKEYGKQFLKDQKSRSQLEGLLQQLQSGSGNVRFERMTIHDEGGGVSASSKSIVFLNSLNSSIRKLQQVDLELETINYGLCS